MPRFLASVVEAYNEMTSLESPNDFFIAGFIPGTEELELIAKGRGGLERVKEVLRAQFESDVAVAMFRVTAVDDRGKVKSFRTKLIHVVYVGPKTPVMKRAKVGPWNAIFKQPFTMNLSVQTDDVDSDLSEAQLERTLRASGGAHQPTSFDFSNVSNFAEGVIASENSFMSTGSASPAPPMSPSSVSSPGNVPRSPSGNRSYVHCWNEQNRAFHSRDVESIKRQYAEDHSKLIVNDTSLGFAVYQGPEEIAEAFSKFFEAYHDACEIVKVEKDQPDGDHTSEGIVFSHWISEQGAVTCGETLCIVGGKIVVHTIVIHRCEGSTAVVEEQDVRSEATADEEAQDAVSNQADAGESITTPEPQESVASNDDGFVEVATSTTDVEEAQGGGAVADDELVEEVEEQQLQEGEGQQLQEGEEGEQQQLGQEVEEERNDQ